LGMSFKFESQLVIIYFVKHRDASTSVRVAPVAMNIPGGTIWSKHEQILSP
jgi:hypothetical protein